MNYIYLNINQAEESRIIIARGEKLLIFEQEIQGEENQKGNIYTGVVNNIEPSLEAAFVDFGEDKNGLLPLREVPPNAPGISEGGLAVGDKLLVQVRKDNTGEKGAGLSGYISIAGRFLVLQPYRQGGRGVFAGAGDNARREMSNLMTTLPVPENMSIIARPESIRHSREDIVWDLESYLLRLWEAIQNTARQVEKPVLIYRENDISLRVMRDYFRPARQDVIVCDHQERYQELKAFVEMMFPENVGQVRYHDSAHNLVPHNIEQQIEQIYQREVMAESGVRVVFDSTEALVAIDVNSGSQNKGSDIEETALKTNQEAAEIIAQQIKLRNLSGLIIIDFIDMKEPEHRAQLEQQMTGLLRKDRARTRNSRISEFGLMEVSRQRVSRTLVHSQMRECARCSGSGRVWRDEAFALHLLRRLRAVAFDNRTKSVIMQVPREVSVFLLNAKRSEIQNIEAESGCDIVIIPDNRFAAPTYKMRQVRGPKNSAIKSANVMMRKGEANEYNYRPPAEIRKRQPVIKNMLPQDSMPSRQTGFWKQLGSAFGKLFGAAPSGRGKTRAAYSGRGGRQEAKPNARVGKAQGKAAGDYYSNAQRRAAKNPAAAPAEAGAEANGGRQRIRRDKRNSGAPAANGHKPEAADAGKSALVNKAAAGKPDSADLSAPVDKAADAGKFAPVNKAVPAGKPDSANQSAPAGKAADAGKSLPVNKAAAGKPDSADQSAPADKAADAGKFAPVNKAVPAGKPDSASQSAPADKAADAGKFAPVNKAMPAGKPDSANQSAPAGKAADAGKSLPINKAAPVKPAADAPRPAAGGGGQQPDSITLPPITRDSPRQADTPAKAKTAAPPAQNTPGEIPPMSDKKPLESGWITPAEKQIPLDEQNR